MKIVENNANSHLQPVPKPPIDPGDKENKKRNILFIMALGLLVVAGFIFWLIKNNPDFFQSITSGNKSDNVATSMFPIWIAVLLPFIVAKKKKMAALKKEQSLADKKELNPEQQRAIKLVVLGIALALIFGILFLFLNS